MLLYFLVLRGCFALLGFPHVAPTELFLRLPWAAAGVAAAVVVYLLGRRLFGPVAGVVGGGLYLANFLQLILAQTARAYTFELLLLGISWYALFRALDGNRAGWWATYVAAG